MTELIALSVALMIRFIDKLDHSEKEKKLQPTFDLDLIEKYNVSQLLLREDFRPKNYNEARHN